VVSSPCWIKKGIFYNLKMSENPQKWHARSGAELVQFGHKRYVAR
jgi:hypothetical protein